MRSKSIGIGFTLPLHIPARFAAATAILVTGKKGEKILAGGLPGLSGLVGGPNNFKTTTGIFLEGAALNTVNASVEAWGETHDSESTLVPDRLTTLTSGFKYLPADTFDPDMPLWELTSNGTLYGDEWLTHIKEKSNEKVKNKRFTEYTFNGKKEIIPTVTLLDSLSKLESEKSVNLLLNSDKDNSDTNMYYMGKGLFKDKALSMMPRLVSTTKNYIIVTAHIGDKKDISASKFSIPEKKIQHLKSDKKVRGVPDSFYELPHVIYQAMNGRSYFNQTTKLPEFPRSEGETLKDDLNVVKIRVLRNKLGPTGFEWNLILSQTEGVQIPLTDLVYLRDNSKYGLDGSDRSYYLDIYPDVKLSRTTFRGIAANDPLLQRALELTADLHQYKTVKPEFLGGNYMEPKELFKKINDLGYDWKELLSTRGWWTTDQYSSKLPPYMSIVDLLEIANGVKKPYFIKKDK